ncbi:MAG: App1 family protein [Cocleimonas sp.]|nr:App1 family protein [Cocleimonas sp.]
MLRLLLLIPFFNLVLNSLSAYAFPIASDENIIIFPSSAHLTKKGTWTFPVHYWVFEIEDGSLSQTIGLKTIGETLELVGFSDEETESERFKARLKWFLVDNKGWKAIDIKLSKINADDRITLNSTAFNGHAYTKVFLALKKSKQIGHWLKINVTAIKNDPRHFSGEVQLIPEQGLSVISDLDDTIKISEVLDKKKLLKNIFVKPYQVCQGMPELFQRLKKKGAYFHYVSASPWQLYPSLKLFMDKYYPKGTLMMRHFRLQDSSFFKFFGSSQDYKIKEITQIIQRYPKHRFILIGDSGEHDPEVYANIYHQFPNNIQSIWIRRVTDSDVSQQRIQTTFKAIPKPLWKFFDTPEKIQR